MENRTVAGEDLHERVRVAARLAQEAGQAITPLQAKREALDAREKSSPSDFVTRADLQAEALITRGLKRAFPADGFIAEEGTARPTRSGLSWGVDPVDGTSNFIQGISHWCISIGCLDATGSVLGVVYDPSRGEVYSAIRGVGAWCHDAGLAPRRSPGDVAGSTWAIGFANDTSRSRRAAWAKQVCPMLGTCRAMGSLALDLAWTAAGRFDAFVYECALRPWDYAGGAVICTEVGLELFHVPQTAELMGALVAIPPEWQGVLDPLLDGRGQRLIRGLPRG